MTDQPRAIETRYNGYRFRSRLEARWAVFFDALKIRYEYEKEGYNLPNYYDLHRDGSTARVLYLPDFWLPDLECFVEIKGPKPDWDDATWDQDDNKLTSLAMETGKPVYLFFGECWWPWWGGRSEDGPGWVYFRQQTRSWVGGELSESELRVSMDTYHWWCECPWCGRIGITKRSIHALLPCHCQVQHDSGVFKIEEDDPQSPRLTDAFLAARQARFEHGESGAPRG